MEVIVTILEFRNQLQSQGYAEGTIELYQRHLDLFRSYLKDIEITDLRKVTKQTLFDYRKKIMAEPIAMETKALKIRPVKRLFEYLTDNHRLLINPAEGLVETCRKNRKIGTVLTVTEMKTLLKQPNLSLNTGIRDRAMMVKMNYGQRETRSLFSSLFFSSRSLQFVLLPVWDGERLEDL